MSKLQFKLKGDISIWISIFILTSFGLLAVYSSTNSLAFAKQGGQTEFYIFRHIIFVLAGLFIMYLIHNVDYRYFSGPARWLIWISIILLAVTMFAGNDINEAKRTLTIPLIGISFQTSDLARVALVMYIARFISRNQDKLDDKNAFLKLVGVIAITCILILPENLSTSLVLFATCVGLLFIGNVSLKYIGILLGSGFILALLGGLILLKTPESKLPGRAKTWKSRIENFKGGESKDAFQTVQAKIAIANGGISGMGPGRGIQKNILPHPYSDFIYATIIEEYGLWGGFLIMGVFLFILYRSIKIVIKSPRAFGAILAVGLSFTLVFQALIHMAVATTLMPVTGLTLPLVSMGGTSMIFTSVAFGIILSVSRTIEDDVEKEA